MTIAVDWDVKPQPNKQINMLIQDISRFENSVDPFQLASEKPADQNLHCFPLCLQIHACQWNHAGKLEKKSGRR